MKKVNQSAKSMQMMQKYEVIEVNHYKKVSYGNLNSSLLYGEDSSDDSIEKLPKLKELMLKNLSKHCTLQIQKHFSKWKISSAIKVTQKLYTMISILHRIFLNKGKRVFQPPRIIKDADEIMTRTIKKIIQIKNRLLDSAFFRWRLFKTALHTKEKAVVFYRACQLAGHNFRDAFYNWREKTLARQSIKRTAATQMMQRILSKCFRGRFKVFVFKTYMRVGVKQAVGRIFTLLSQKYIENNRLSFRMWKEMFGAWEIQREQVGRDVCLYRMVEIWKKFVKGKLRTGFGKLMKNNRVLKMRLMRTLISSYKGKKYRCWVAWAKAADNFKTKFQALKMATALKRAARKPQKFGFRVFLPKTLQDNKLQCLQDFYFKRLIWSFFRIKTTVKNNEIWTKKQEIKNLRINLKQTETRSKKQAIRYFKTLLQILMKKNFNFLTRVVHEKKAKTKYSLEVISQTFTKKTKSVLKTWRKTTRAKTSEIYKNGINAYKFQYKLSKIPIQTLKLGFKHILSSESRVKTALRVFFSKMEKPVSLALSAWKSYKDQVNEKKLLNAIKTHKLRFSLSKVPSLTLKNALTRLVTSETRVKSAVRRVIQSILKIPKATFYTWKSYIQLCKSQIVLDNYRSSKLKGALFRTSLRVLRHTFDRILGEGDLVKGALKKIVQCLVKKKTCAWNSWKVFDFQCKNREIMTNVQSLKLKSKLSGVILRTERGSFKRIVGGGDAVKGALQSVMGKILTRPKFAMKAWNKYAQDCKEKVLMTNFISEKLRNALSKIPRRVLKNAYQRIVGNGNACIGALKTIFLSLNKKMMFSFTKLRNFNELCKKNILMTSIKSFKLRQTLTRLPLQRLCFGFSLITRPHNYVGKKLRVLNRGFILRFQRFFKCWKKNYYGDLNKEKNFRSISHIFRCKLQKTLWMWKDYAHCLTQELILIVFKGQKLQLSMQKVVRKRLQIVKAQILYWGNQIELKLTLLSLKYYRKPKVVFRTWKDYVYNVKKGKLLDTMRTEKLKIAISKITFRTLTSVTRIILFLPGLIKKSFRIFLQNRRDNCKKTLTSWSRYVHKCKQGQLLDAVRTQKLRKHLSDINRRQLRDAVERVLGDGSKVKGSLRRMMLQVHKCKMLSLQKWKDWFMRARAQEAAKKIKGYQLQTILRKVPERTLRSAIDRIIGNGARAIGAVRRMMSHLKTRCGNAFQVWKDFLSQVKERDLKRAIILKSLVDLIIQRTSRIMIDSILGDCRVRRLLNKLVNNYKSIEKAAFDQIWGRVEKVRTIRKINSAYFVFKNFVAMAKKIVETRFIYWKNLEYLRQRRIMRKAMGKIIQTISISYEIGYWRWKFVLSCTGTQLNPKHSLFFKRLFVLASNYMRRLEQFALFKMVLNYKTHPMTNKLSLPKALANLLKNSAENDMTGPTLDTKALNTESAFDDFYGNLSTVPPSCIRNNEILRVKQKGAAQVLYLNLQHVLHRKIALGLMFIDAYTWRFSTKDEEKFRVLEQINELKYEKLSLLEDNNTLRVHNDSLISRLEKNTAELEEISLALDLEKIGKMIKNIQRQSDFVIFGAFYCIASFAGEN